MKDPLLIFALGFIGGGLVEIVKWLKLRDSINFPDYIKKPVYWVLTVLMILGGGAVAWIYSLVGDINALLAVNVGASAPLIVAGLATTPPKPPQPRTTPPQPPQPATLTTQPPPPTDEPRETSQSQRVREFLSWR